MEKTTPENECLRTNRPGHKSNGTQPVPENIFWWIKILKITLHHRSESCGPIPEGNGLDHPNITEVRWAVCLRQTVFSVRSYGSRIFNIVALSVPTRGLRPLERWLCQCQLAAFGRSNGGFVSANSRPSAARTVALSVPTRGLRPLERWLCQCQLAAFGRSNGGFVSANSRPSAARTVALSVPTRGLRPFEWWLCQCQLAAFGRSNGGFVSANSRTKIKHP
ncbi:hypothetical protein Ddc_13314 [Ditylenchus destructor]|nr:hypothetical protein Ddc_13314 [Ditylenchus destructor]